ncbi:hypothetical protein PI124_g18917 [Phytophthora idaei]|nr:hypothetical protein PI126_g18273 [Phytophthora idaei]KAG3236066.1 hypothetical protein PI124_g18917 [Phytophthora idaei]
MLDHVFCTEELQLYPTREPIFDRLGETTLNQGFVFVCRGLPLDHTWKPMFNRLWEAMLNHSVS